MSSKEIICPGRLRHLPEGFGWIDHRLVREKIIENYSCEALALYLFLLTVADEDGVSWYSDTSISRRLQLTQEELKQARRDLSEGKLIAYRRPYYQVLELPQPAKKQAFRDALSEALKAVDDDSFQRQPAGTEGMGVSLYPKGGIYRRPADTCDALPLETVISAIAGDKQ